MKFFWEPRNTMRWRRRFALLPTTIGTMPDGTVVRIWGEFYEVRRTPSGSMEGPRAKERRPLHSIPELKYYGEDGAIEDTFSTVLPFLY